MNWVAEEIKLKRVGRICHMPLGVMWVGIATRILNEIIRSYPDGIKDVITGELNRYSLPWGKRLGFIKDQECGHWRLAVNRTKKCRDKEAA